MKHNKTLLPILAGFFVMGFGGIIGTVMFQIKNECAAHADQISYLILIFAYLWFVVISIPTGLMCGRIGRKKTVLVSLSVTIAAMGLAFVANAERWWNVGGTGLGGAKLGLENQRGARARLFCYTIRSKSGGRKQGADAFSFLSPGGRRPHRPRESRMPPALLLSPARKEKGPPAIAARTAAIVPALLLFTSPRPMPAQWSGGGAGTRLASFHARA